MAFNESIYTLTKWKLTKTRSWLPSLVVYRWFFFAASCCCSSQVLPKVQLKWNLMLVLLAFAKNMFYLFISSRAIVLMAKVGGTAIEFQVYTKLFFFSVFQWLPQIRWKLHVNYIFQCPQFACWSLMRFLDTIYEFPVLINSTTNRLHTKVKKGLKALKFVSNQVYLNQSIIVDAVLM